ncbi:HTH-type transcriptional regulator BetI [Achromobacter anxifer]|jgi:AcrR family transcriptional regulator|uniref:HTH-type transcriptional regulator BetI n=1 Tax=Achromobacter anxifer TaxID=1287737 RepID=A0A6S7E6I0_9BURK|nr:HTH-type transcriptional regulator BetI [Achromobacter anxifer]CAB5517214.1 HTH-type transcriptional regulator BetI [Achromobacter anxifer]
MAAGRGELAPLPGHEDEVSTISTDTAPRALTSKGEARRERLLEAATRSLLEHGYAQTSIQHVVRQAGGSAATAYQLFGNKEGLLVAVLEHELDNMRAAVFPGAMQDQPVGQALHELAQRLLSYALQPDSVALYRLMVSEAHRLPQLAASLRLTVEKQLHSPLEQCLRKACERGELRIDDPRLAARTLGNLINGIASHARLTGGWAEGPDAECLATCRYGVDTLLRAFRP